MPMPIDADRTLPLLGLAPLVVPASSLESALLLAATVATVTIVSLALITTTDRLSRGTARVPARFLIVSTLVVVLMLGMQAFVFEALQPLLLWIPLIAVNGFVHAALERAIAAPQRIDAIRDLVTDTLVFCTMLIVLGAIREGVDVWPGTTRLLVFATPAGAFILAGLLLAAVQQFLPRESPR